MITNISVERLNPHPDNPRKDLGDLTELAESIKAMEDYLINGEGPEPKGLFGSNDS